jgi:hypothetical protein
MLEKTEDSIKKLATLGTQDTGAKTNKAKKHNTEN